MIYLFTLLPKNLYIICKFAKMDMLKPGKAHTNKTIIFKLFSTPENDTPPKYLAQST